MPFVVVVSLTHDSCHWTQISSGFSNGGYQQRMSIKLARVLSSIHAISIWLVVCAGPACVQHTLARPDSQFLCCTRVYFLCDILWSEVQSHSDSSHMHACNWSTFCIWTCPGSPTMSCIHLVFHSIPRFINWCSLVVFISRFMHV